MGTVFRKLDEIGAGEARRDTGSPTRSISSGITSNRDGKDIWMRNAVVSNAAETRPIFLVSSKELSEGGS